MLSSTATGAMNVLHDLTTGERNARRDGMAVSRVATRSAQEMRLGEGVFLISMLRESFRRGELTRWFRGRRRRRSGRRHRAPFAESRCRSSRGPRRPLAASARRGSPWRPRTACCRAGCRGREGSSTTSPDWPASGDRAAWPTRRPQDVRRCRHWRRLRRSSPAGPSMRAFRFDNLGNGTGTFNSREGFNSVLIPPGICSRSEFRNTALRSSHHKYFKLSDRPSRK